jgi:hypothetical protein
MPPAHLGRRHSGLLFFDHPNDLRLGKTALSHVSAPSELVQTLHHGEGFRGGQVISNGFMGSHKCVSNPETGTDTARATGTLNVSDLKKVGF